jgi:hypothetical protein
MPVFKTSVIVFHIFSCAPSFVLFQGRCGGFSGRGEKKRKEEEEKKERKGKRRRGRKKFTIIDPSL